jgi:peptide/nickel transport system substrate-binding protein
MGTAPRFTRRQTVKGAMLGGFALTGLGVLGCSSSNKANVQPSVATRAPAASGSTTTSGPASAASRAAGAAPAASPSAVAARRGGKVRVGTIQDAFNLDPFTTAAGRDHHYLFQIYDALFTYTQNDLSPHPYLAQTPEIASPTQIIFKLRTDVKFHDGSSLTAELVRQNINKVMDPSTKSVQAGLMKAIDHIEVVDPTTVRLNLNTPSAPILDYLSYNPGLMEAAVALTGDAATKPVGAGPFSLVNRVQNDTTQLKRFEGYWDAGLPYLDQLDLKVISDGTTRVNALRSGDIDIAQYVPPQNIKQLEADKTLTVAKRTNLAHHLVYVQSAKPPFNDVRLRQAVSLAIDRKELVDKVLFGEGDAAAGTLTPSQWAFDPQATISRFDPKAATQLLAAAGQPNGFQFEAVTQATSPFQEHAEAIQLQLSKVGIKMDIKLLDSATFTANLVQGAFVTLLSQWAGAADPDFTFFNRYDPSGGYNANRHNVPAVTSLLDKARQSYDQNERTKLYRQADKLIFGVDEGGLALDWILAYPAEAHAMHKNIQGYVPYGDGKMRAKYIFVSAS